MIQNLKNLFRKTYKIEINYKSGIQKIIKVYKFDIKKEGGALTSVTWEIAGSGDCMLFGLNDVESIYVV